MTEKENNHKHRKIVTILVIALAICVPLAGYVTASYLLTSNHISGTANSQAVLTITANNTNVIIGDILLVTAHLNDSKANVPIQFFNGTTALSPLVNTDAYGNAIVYYTVSNAYDLYAMTNHP
jgi:hypothetical protein